MGKSNTSIVGQYEAHFGNTTSNMSSGNFSSESSNTGGSG